jgi:hypothetical protein
MGGASGAPPPNLQNIFEIDSEILKLEKVFEIDHPF